MPQAFQNKEGVWIPQEKFHAQKIKFCYSCNCSLVFEYFFSYLPKKNVYTLISVEVIIISATSLFPNSALITTTKTTIITNHASKWRGTCMRQTLVSQVWSGMLSKFTRSTPWRNIARRYRHLLCQLSRPWQRRQREHNGLATWSDTSKFTIPLSMYRAHSVEGSPIAKF